jgi:glycosyltransferase involved in cell wall biosynthesis
MSAPCVSVVLPTFNRLEFLKCAVQSVTEQTYMDWNLIIADDGSNEHTRAYLRSLSNPSRITLIELAHSGNPAAVRNAALRAATGEYVAFLDSDDVWMPMKLERQVASLRVSGRRWGYTGYSRIDASGRVSQWPGTRQWVPYRGFIFDQLLMFEAEVSTPAVLVERRLLDEVGGFDEQQTVFEDYDLWLRLALRYEIDLIDQPLVQLRSHDQHYECDGIPRAAGRHRLLTRMHPYVRDPSACAAVQRLRADVALNLAHIQCESSRMSAAATVLSSARYSWRQGRWWKGAARVALKAAVPRSVLATYRRRRPPPVTTV